MANPVTTARGVPIGFPLKEGYKVHVAFSLNPRVSFFEVDLMPPAFMGSPPDKVTTQDNVQWHTKAPNDLIESGDAEGSCAYDPLVQSQIAAMINLPGSITFHLPDSSTIDYWGWLQEFKPDTMKDGMRPMAKFKITISNFDPVNFVEAGPVYTPPSVPSARTVPVVLDVSTP